MRKFLTAGMAAVTLAGAVAATAGPAEARDHRHYRRGNDNTAAAVAAGIAGLAIGAALASSSRDNGAYSRSYYDRGYAYAPRREAPYGYYYGPPRYYDSGPGYRLCETRERMYDPYIDRPVMVTRRYPC